MRKLSLLYIFFLNFLVLRGSAEFDGENYRSHQSNRLNSLIAKGLNHLHRNLLNFLEDTAGSLLDSRLSGVDPDFNIRQNGNSSLNSKCLDDVLFILKSIEEKQQWALSVIDSYGKLPSGILQGNFRWPGDYNECIGVTSTNPNSTVGNFRGKYCSLTWTLPDVLKMPFPLETGICVPDSCPDEELRSFLNVTHLAGFILNDTSYDVNVTIACKATERHLNNPAKAIIVILSILCMLAILGSSITAVEYFKTILKESSRPSFVVNIPEYDQDFLVSDVIKSTRVEPEGFLGKLQKFLGCFCVFTNGAKLLNTDSSEGQLLCIHGIRFLSMSWVILGHTNIFPFLRVINNEIEALKLIDSFAFQAVLQGSYSVDSFFVLSGFLLTYLTMKEFAKKRGVISWPQFYIHRYVRLTPIYMILLGFSATVFLYLGSGPYWPVETVDSICTDNWWRNLLYINNWSQMSEQCMAWSWYLANDMQFFVISPLFLITLWRWPKIGYSLIGMFLCVDFLSNFLITYHYDLSTGLTSIIGNPLPVMLRALEKHSVFQDKLYIKPYARIGPYLIGILVAYLVFKRNESDKPKHSLTFLCVGWIAAISVTLTCVYGLYHKHPTVVTSGFYNGLSRTCFAAGLCWVIYVCLIGQGGVVNSILSYKPFIPLSRLTYTVYLIHPMIRTGYYLSLKTSYYFSHPTTVLLYLGIMVVSYGLALPVALILESPVVSLEKFVRKALSNRKDS